MNRQISIHDYSFSDQDGLFWVREAEDSIVSSFKEELHRNRSILAEEGYRARKSGNLHVPEAIKETGTIARASGSDTMQPPRS